MKTMNLYVKRHFTLFIMIPLLFTLFAAPALASTPVKPSYMTNQEWAAHRVVSSAEWLIGKVEYQYAVNDPQNLILDCSSFTKYLYKIIGINLTWSSLAQSKQGSYVSRSNIRRGDLVFFTTIHAPNTISHVGIYMGNNKFISNLPGSNISIRDLHIGWWADHYVTARRVIY